MIVLNRVDGNEILVNSEYIKRVEEGDPTLVFMSVGDQLVVKESLNDIKELMEAKSFVPAENDFKKRDDDRKHKSKQPSKKTKKKPTPPPKDVSHEF